MSACGTYVIEYNAETSFWDMNFNLACNENEIVECIQKLLITKDNTRILHVKRTKSDEVHDLYTNLY